MQPSNYSYVGWYYQGPSLEVYKEMARDFEFRAARELLEEKPWTGGNHYNKGTCDHCGAAFMWGAVLKDKQTGEGICIGHICLTERFEMNDSDWDRKRHMSAIRRLQNFGRFANKARKWLEENEDLREVLGRRNGEDAPNGFLSNLSIKLWKYGELTEKQAEAARKSYASYLEGQAWLKAHPEVAEAFEEAEREARKALKQDEWGNYKDDAAADAWFNNRDMRTLYNLSGKLSRWGSLTPGQQELIEKIIHREEIEVVPVVTGKAVEITGKILTTKRQESHYGTQYKMLVLDDRGFKVWGTIANSLHGSYEEGNHRTVDELIGCRVTFVAQVDRSERDADFGFFKRPRKATVIEEEGETA
jgi:hypothetical protein